MAYVFQNVHIFAFDVHATTRHLLQPKLLRPEFAFLSNAVAYRKRHKAGAPIKTAHFLVQPLPRRERIWNHFWKAYGRIWHGKSADDWKLQMPFVCRPLDTKAEVDTGGESFRINVRPVIYLSSLGWSNNLEISISGSITPEDLTTFVRLLPQQLPWLRLNGVPRDLHGAFQHFTTQLQADLYANSQQAVNERVLNRYLIISLAQCTGPAAPYATSWDPESAHMDGASRALMHGILSGEEISLAKLSEMEKKENKKFLLTRFGEGGFALTYFDQRTLLFLHDRAMARPNRRKLLRCLGANIRTCTMMSLILLHFYNRSALQASAHAQTRALRKAIEHTLRDLPARYTNAFCRALYLKHAQLQKFSQMSTS